MKGLLKKRSNSELNHKPLGNKRSKSSSFVMSSHTEKTPGFSSLDAANDKNNNNNDNTSRLFLDTWLACGKFALSLNSNYQIAIKCFESALKFSPTNKTAFNLLVDSLVNHDYKIQNIDGIHKTIELINSKINYYPELGNDIELKCKLAEYYLLINEFDKAHSLIATALESKKDEPLLWLYLGKCLYKSNLPGDSIDTLTNCLYLLPNELKAEKDIKIARDVHLELAQLSITDGDLESARNELGAALSLPPPKEPRSIEICLSLIRHLIISFEKSGNLMNSLWICEIAETTFPEEPFILLIHSYLLLLSDKSFFNPNKARQLLHKVIQKDKYYIESLNLVDYIYTNQGDFLPWLLLTESYHYLKYDSIAFDCLEISTRKIHYPSILPNFKSLASKILDISDNNILREDIKRFIQALDNSPKVNENISIVDAVMMTYDERLEYFNNRVFLESDANNGNKNKPNISGFIRDEPNGLNKLTNPNFIKPPILREQKLTNKQSPPMQLPLRESLTKTTPNMQTSTLQSNQSQSQLQSQPYQIPVSETPSSSQDSQISATTRKLPLESQFFNKPYPRRILLAEQQLQPIQQQSPISEQERMSIASTKSQTQQQLPLESPLQYPPLSSASSYTSVPPHIPYKNTEYQQINIGEGIPIPIPMSLQIPAMQPQMQQISPSSIQQIQSIEQLQKMPPRPPHSIQQMQQMQMMPVQQFEPMQLHIGQLPPFPGPPMQRNGAPEFYPVPFAPNQQLSQQQLPLPNQQEFGMPAGMAYQGHMIIPGPQIDPVQEPPCVYGAYY
jgi:tetratricopeptide (TPR) repeat protein